MKSQTKKNNLVWCVVEIHVMMVTRLPSNVRLTGIKLVAVECTEGDICCFASIYIGLPSNNPRRPSLG